MAGRGLTLAWADRPLTLTGARSVGRAANCLSAELPDVLTEADRAIAGLVEVGLGPLTEVDLSAALARALPEAAGATSPVPAGSGVSTRVIRGDLPAPSRAAVEPAPEPAPAGVPPRATLVALGRRHLHPVPRVETAALRPPTAPERMAPIAPRSWVRSGAPAVAIDMPSIGRRELAAMAAPRGAAVTAPARAAAPSQAAAAILPAARVREGRPLAEAPTTSGPAAGVADPVTATGGRSIETPHAAGAPHATVRHGGRPRGSGLAALVAAWEEGTDGAERAGGGRDAVPGPPAPGAGSPEVTVVEPFASFDSGFSAPSVSDLDAETALLDVLARALRSEARRYGIEPDSGWSR